ncbi:MAG: hypothetical protein WC812_04705 [Candidatus Pacearchaeota archaeon]|jgi:hypothetical protein
MTEITEYIECKNLSCDNYTVYFFNRENSNNETGIIPAEIINSKNKGKYFCRINSSPKSPCHVIKTLNLLSEIEKKLEEH